MDATLDAGYIGDRSSGSLALSRSKSGHQLPLQRGKPGAPTAVAEHHHHHQPLDFSQSLSSALEFGGRKRRNSFSHLFNRQRASSEQYTSSTFSSLQQPRPSSAQKQHSKYRIIRLPFVSNKEPTNPDLTVLKLEDSFADIRLQLANMSQETQDFSDRVQMLSRAVTDLSSQQLTAQKEGDDQADSTARSSPVAAVNRSQTTYFKSRRHREQPDPNHYSASTLPLPPIERVQSQPSPLLNSWSFLPVGSQSTDSSSGSQSSNSQLTTSAGSMCEDSPGLIQLGQLPDINVLVVEDSDSSRSSDCDELKEQDDEVFNLY